MSYDRAALREMLIRHEGLKLMPYVDTVGKTTIGVGRNIEDVGISRAEALFLLDNDIADREAAFDRLIPWWRSLSDARQRVLIDMSFMGVVKLMGFKLMLAALQRGDYDEAARQMLSSLWAKQVKDRAPDLASMMRQG